jgi:hypothetical protein
MTAANSSTVTATVGMNRTVDIAVSTTVDNIVPHRAVTAVLRPGTDPHGERGDA